MKHDNLKNFLDRARRGQPSTPSEAPFGFATRVAARWAATPSASDPLRTWELLTRWGLAGAFAVCLAVSLMPRPEATSPEPPSALDAFAGFDGDEDVL